MNIEELKEIKTNLDYSSRYEKHIESRVDALEKALTDLINLLETSNKGTN